MQVSIAETTCTLLLLAVTALSACTETARAAENRRNLSNADTVSLFDASSTLDYAPAAAAGNHCTAGPASISTTSLPIEPTLTYERICDPLVGYSGLYRKHRLVLPMRVNSSSPEAIVTGIEVKVDDTLAAALQGTSNSSVQILAQLRKQWSATGNGQVVFLCNTFARCQQLKESIEADPEEMWHSIRFTVKLRMTRKQQQQKFAEIVQFDDLQTVNLPEFVCDPDAWVVFQRRVDGNLSFVQNWDAYVNGFGHPDSNYWMGLDKLFVMTATSQKRSDQDTSKCRLRVELRDFNGSNYWAEYGLFQVLDSGQNYRLRIGKKVANSQLIGFVTFHGEMQFSTYDRKNDRMPTVDSCSKLYGYGGWWYGACHHVNPNGAYLTNRNITDSPVYASFRLGHRFIPLKYIEMKFKCG